MKPTERITTNRNLALAYIKECRKDGWWPYVPDGDPSLETTAWIALALRHDEEAALATLEFFEKNQNPDGGWPSAPQAGLSDWCTAPVVIALRTLATQFANSAHGARFNKCVDRAFDHLLDSRADLFPSALGKTVMFLVQGGKALDYPRGWPWTLGSFHWVEPTSYTLMALKNPKLPQKKELNEIVEKANSFITEHSCKAGGWNHGNNVCLGVNLPPYVVTTAEALLALQDLKENEKVLAGLELLDGKHETAPTAMSLSWTILAKDAHGKKCDKELKQLVSMQKPDGNFGPNLMVTALAALALEVADGGNALKY